MPSDPPIDELLQRLIERIRGALTGLQGVWLFGSHARGQARPTSDIDLAVLGESLYDPVMIFDLGLELGVAARRDVDLVDLRRAPVVLKKEILAGGRRIATEHPEACVAYEANAMALYVAFRDEVALAGRTDRKRP